MKKRAFLSILAGTLLASTTATTFAATNPFSDVPANSWAYAAVQKLAADGVINGYGDGEFHGNDLMTRYQMAQIVAKAMTHENMTKADKALVDKLAAEFSSELETLGVRVANLEKKSDNLKFTGYFQYLYQQNKQPGLHKGLTFEDSSYKTDTVTVANRYQFRLWANADIGNNWTATTRIVYLMNANEGNSASKASVARIFATKKIGDTEINLGKPNTFSDQELGTALVMSGGMMSGAEVDTKFGGDKAWAAKLAGGRVQYDATLNGTIDKDTNINHFLDGTGNMLQAEIGYAQPKGKWLANLGYYYFNDFNGPSAENAYRSYWSKSQVSSEAQKRADYTKSDASPYKLSNNDIRNANSNSIWVASLGYNFDKNTQLITAYGRSNLKANPQYRGDAQNKAYMAALLYKLPGGVAQANLEKAGSWGAYIGYSYLGDAIGNSNLGAGYYEIAASDMKGWEVGMSYIPMPNVNWILSYFTGKQLSVDYGNNDATEKAIMSEIVFYF